LPRLTLNAVAGGGRFPLSGKINLATFAAKIKVFLVSHHSIKIVVHKPNLLDE
jgi:hypothetical protein